MKTSEPCGCSHNGERWLALCPQHETEWATRHANAMAQHRGMKVDIPNSPAEDWLAVPEEAA